MSYNSIFAHKVMNILYVKQRRTPLAIGVQAPARILWLQKSIALFS